MTDSDAKSPIARRDEPAVTACDSTDDPVALSLARSIESATAAGQWSVVADLSRLLADRQRLRAAPDVASLDAARARRERGGK